MKHLESWRKSHVIAGQCDTFQRRDEAFQPPYTDSRIDPGLFRVLDQFIDALIDFSGHCPIPSDQRDNLHAMGLPCNWIGVPLPGR